MNFLIQTDLNGMGTFPEAFWQATLWSISLEMNYPWCSVFVENFATYAYNFLTNQHVLEVFMFWAYWVTTNLLPLIQELQWFKPTPVEIHVRKGSYETNNQTI